MLSFAWLLNIEKIYNVYIKQRERFNQNETFFFFLYLHLLWSIYCCGTFRLLLLNYHPMSSFILKPLSGNSWYMRKETTIIFCLILPNITACSKASLLNHIKSLNRILSTAENHTHTYICIFNSIERRGKRNFNL